MLYLVTNRKLTNIKFLELIEKALSSDIEGIILREKDLSYEKYEKLVGKTKKLTDKYNKKLIINGPLALAENFQAYGYHSPFAKFKKYKKEYKYQGVSIHSIEEAKFAQDNGADYLLVGHIFQTDCKKGLEPRGIDFLKSIIKNVSIPIIAIGGINESNINKLSNLELKGVAVMSGIMTSYNPDKDIKALNRAFNKEDK